MADYEASRLKHLERFGEVLPELMLRVEWPRERIEQEQTDGLRRLVGLACERSPWHGGRLRHIHREPLTIGDLATLPTMTKDDLMSNWNEIVTDPRLTLDLADQHLLDITSDAYLLETYHVVASGGSSGRRGVFVWDWDGWARAFASGVRWSVRHAMRDAEAGSRQPVIAVVGAAAPTHMSSAMPQTFATPFPPTHRFPVTMPMQQIVAGLNAIQPTQLRGYASALYELARAALDGELRIQPTTVAPDGEPLLPEMRGAMERAWGAPVGGTYGTSEGCVTAASCFAAEGMHLSEDLLIVEPVDQEGRAVEAGRTASKILLTNLSNAALPLIRYEITDEVRVLPEPCPCGSPFRRVDDIQGRLDNVFTYEGGVVVHPHVFIAIRASGDVDVPSLTATIVEHLARAGLDRPDIRVERVPAVERTSAGKLMRFVPLSA